MDHEALEVHLMSSDGETPTVRGSVRLRDGRVEADAPAAEFLSTYNVVSPTGDGSILTPSDGVRYLLALPFVLSGSRFWAEAPGVDLKGTTYLQLLEMYEPRSPVHDPEHFGLAYASSDGGAPADVPEAARACRACNSTSRPLWVKPIRNTPEWWDDPSPYWLCGDCGALRALDLLRPVKYEDFDLEDSET